MRKWLPAAAVALSLAACTTVPTASLDEDAAGKQFAPPAAGMSVLYIVETNVAPLSPVTVGQTTAGTVLRYTWLRIDLPAGRYNFRIADGDNAPSRSVVLEAGSTRFVQIKFTNGIPVYQEMPASAGRAAVLAGKRAREIK